MNNKHLIISSVSVIILLLSSFVSIGFAQDEAGSLVVRINDLRGSLGLAGYTVNGALNAAAQQHARYIVETGSVGHVQADGSGPRARALNAGYPSTDVSENVYGGTQANADVAWSFWVNSGIHYRGLTHPGYRDVGVGIASGAWGQAYVLVFGNPGGPPPAPPRSGDGGSGSAGGAVEYVDPPYYLGVDENGNIMHEIQEGDTIGDIALIYGYTWDDIPFMMELNHLASVNELAIGEVFLVPPKGGTRTPSPSPVIPPTNTKPAAPTDTPEPTNTPGPTDTPTDTPTPEPIATAGDLPEALLSLDAATAELIAAAPTVPTLNAAGQGEIPLSGTASIVRSRGRIPVGC